MIIKYEDFTIKPCVHAPIKFDLLRKITRRKIGEGTIVNPLGEEYETESEVGYGYSFERVLEVMCSLITEENNKERELTIKEYLEEYANSKSEIKNYIEQILKVK